MGRADTLTLDGKGGIPCSSGAGGVGSIPINSDVQNVPFFCRWRYEMKLSSLIFICHNAQGAKRSEESERGVEDAMSDVGENQDA